MKVRAIRTDKIRPSQCTVLALLAAHLPALSEGSIVVITSKVVALCEGDVVPVDDIGKDELVRQQADRYVALPDNQYGVIFTVIGDTLIPNAGVDESNAEGVFVLWPHDPQTTANEVRHYLCKRFGLEQVGVIITDSTARPLRWGMGGISIAHSGFKALRDYRGEHDLDGRVFRFETGDVVGGLAAAAVLVMGEGAERTPLAILEELPFVEFQGHDPTTAELEALKIAVEDDLYAPIFTSVPWQDGGKAWRLGACRQARHQHDTGSDEPVSE